MATSNQFTIPRAQPVTENGMALPPAMGSAIGINFESAGGTDVAATGDFISSDTEVNPVIDWGLPEECTWPAVSVRGELSKASSN